MPEANRSRIRSLSTDCAQCGVGGGAGPPHRRPSEVAGHVIQDHPSSQTTHMQATKIDLPQQLSRKLIELINARPANAIELTMQAKQTHWTEAHLQAQA